MPAGKKLLRRSKQGGDSTQRERGDKSDHENVSSDKDIEMANKKTMGKKETKTSAPKSKHVNYSRSGSIQDVLPSDIEEQPVALEDIDDFLSGGGPSGDPFDGYYEGTRINWEYQHDRRGGHMLFIENEETGELVLTDVTGDGSGGGLGGEQDNEFEDSPLLGIESGDSAALYRFDASPVSKDVSAMEKFFLASYIFFQGLLAGFSMALVYVVEQTDTDFDLLVNYQPSSNEIRRILFIFGAISCVGALELFTNSLRRRRYLSNASPGEAASSRDKDGRSSTATTGTGFSQVQLEGVLLPATWAALICYFILFIILLIMAPTDVLISKKNGFDDSQSSGSDDWAVFALDDSKFRTLFHRWKELAIYRVGFAVLGWISSCIVVMLKYLISSQRDSAMSSTMDYVITLRKKIASLQGDAFDPKMTVEDYQQLIKIQRLGMQRSEAALRSKEEELLQDSKTPRL